VSRVRNDVDGLLLESGKVYEATAGAGGDSLSAELWRSVDEVIGLVDCDVYTYKAVAEGDPFCDETNLWSFNYFFYNRKLKRILYFSCRAVSKTADQADSDDERFAPTGLELSQDPGYGEDSFVDDMDMDDY
jgi:hypothetical protein